MGLPAGLRRFAVILVFCQTGAASAAAVLTFDTQGGDAWTFSKIVSGTVLPGACDTIRLASPLGPLPAQMKQDRFTAIVPLREGSNDIRATCIRGGRRVNHSARQRW